MLTGVVSRRYYFRPRNARPNMRMHATSAGADVAPARLDEIDQTCRHGLYLIALRSLGDEEDAREVVQETVARTIEALTNDRVPAHVPVPAFIHGVARHVIIDMLRHRVRRASMSVESPDEVAEECRSSLDALIADEDRQRLSLALRRLPAGEQELLRRCYVMGEGLIDIARSSGEPAERIRKRKSRALDRLRRLLDPPRHESTFRATEGS